MTATTAKKIKITSTPTGSIRTREYHVTDETDARQLGDGRYVGVRHLHGSTDFEAACATFAKHAGRELTEAEIVEVRDRREGCAYSDSPRAS